MEHVTIGPPNRLDVIPFGDDGGKQLVIADPSTGRVYYYPMAKEMAENIGKDLRMTNAALADKKEREAAAARLVPANGDAVSPQEAAVTQQLLDGHGRRPQG